MNEGVYIHIYLFIFMYLYTNRPQNFISMLSFLNLD